MQIKNFFFYIMKKVPNSSLAEVNDRHVQDLVKAENKKKVNSNFAP